jgi:UDP-2-acetamido-3-amino-2,3-dideoxy-glucuronate N-acetyltransferase
MEMSAVPIASDAKLSPTARIPQPELVNLYGCEVGAETLVGPFVEIQSGVVVGARCKISSHSFVCTGVTIEDEVFVGHGVMFTNDRFPRATTRDGAVAGPGDWTMESTVVQRGAAIGSGAVILSGITIGHDATVGAGAVVTRDVEPGTVVVGCPARLLRGSNATDQ